jgi:hypothetical protein
VYLCIVLFETFAAMKVAANPQTGELAQFWKLFSERVAAPSLNGFHVLSAPVLEPVAV